jgi:hypothetical protein
MGFTPNVVDGNIILASWGNDGIRDRTLQVFATAAERDQQWPAAPNGAICVTLDTGQHWRHLGGAWYPETEVFAFAIPQLDLATASDFLMAQHDFGVRPYARMVHATLHTLGDAINAAVLPRLKVGANGAPVRQYQAPSLAAGQSVSLELSMMWPCPAGTGCLIEAWGLIMVAGGAYRITPDPTFSVFDITVRPQ